MCIRDRQIAYASKYEKSEKISQDRLLTVYDEWKIFDSAKNSMDPYLSLIHISFEEIVKEIWPWILTMGIGLIFVIFIPQMSTWLPGLMK